MCHPMIMKFPGLLVLLVAVSHADALKAVSRLDGRRGLLHSQPVVDGLVALAVERGVQDALQPEVPVGLLWIWEGWRHKTSETCSHKRRRSAECFHASGGGFDLQSEAIRNPHLIARVKPAHVCTLVHHEKTKAAVSRSKMSSFSLAASSHLCRCFQGHFTVLPFDFSSFSFKVTSDCFFMNMPHFKFFSFTAAAFKPQRSVFEPGG